jgi:hypothetical protein
MKKLPVPTNFGHTIFCDDIRNEVDGKVTYVGVYNGSMIVNGAFPFTLAKFAVSATLVLDAQDKSVYSFHIFLPGDAEGMPSVKIDSVNSLNGNDLPKLFDEDPRFALSFNGVLSSLVIASEGIIEVRAVKNEEYIRLGRLRVSSSIGL